MSNESAIVGPLDMTNGGDRGLLRRIVTDALNGRATWNGIDDQFKDDAVRALKVALRMALEKKDHRGIKGVVETLSTLTRVNQADIHKAIEVAMYNDKNARIDSGQATEAVVFNISPVTPQSRLEG